MELLVAISMLFFCIYQILTMFKKKKRAIIITCFIFFIWFYMIINPAYASMDSCNAHMWNVKHYRINYTKEEVNILNRLVMAESGGETYECQLLVACVIINRVNDERYPNSLMAVMYDKEPVWQFTPIAQNNIDLKASDSVIKAVEKAMQHDYSNGCWMFNNSSITDTSKQNWFDKYEVIFDIDGVQFRR